MTNPNPEIKTPDAFDAAAEGREEQAPRLSYGFARAHDVVLLDYGTKAVLGARQPLDGHALLEARRVLRRPLRVDSLDGADFDRLLSERYSLEGMAGDDLASGEGDHDLDSLIDDIPQSADLLDSADDAPIIRLINGLIAQAVRRRASDIHIAPFEPALLISFRIDGILHEALRLPPRLAPRLISRIKVMARLDITEKRIPLDGRVSLSLGGKSIDVRVSTLPSRHGERVVMRLLDKDQAHFHLDALGMSRRALADLQQALAQPNGIILVTGPTGSGKTTTLYAGLSQLNDGSRNILTIEDPVEYALDGVGQTQVNSRVGMSFAAGLRAILRQDPDVVMVGEIRDVETAQIAVQASLTGHLVLSTVHTNSAVAAITRLRDMGVEPFLLASTVKAIIAQRLVRRLCSHCKEAYAPDPAERRILGLDAAAPAPLLYRPTGCDRCNHSGHEGRIGLYELVTIEDQLRQMIHDNATEDALAEVAFMKRQTLLQSGLDHCLDGACSLTELMRVCQPKGAADASL
ncbi:MULTISPECIES: type II secretion system ATPase GspE [unclassified Iodidimonas]|jgi:general secretion pathway protein E|uniref:type II secretion system ATPase GspE n=1 Tax=unclassified Iodidimonas TaxID=2626145 RepID=UPI002482A44F|nr:MULTISPECIES: type II secretion system ATPase GspE [unclassified Iodidimonas]